MVENNDSWVVNITQELQSWGLGQMWDELITCKECLYKNWKENIFDTEKQIMLAKLSNSNKCISNQHLIDMVAYFCHHLSGNYVDLSYLYVHLSDLYIDLSLIHLSCQIYILSCQLLMLTCQGIMSTCQKNVFTTSS